MINIKEQTAKKLPGISSLFVTFNYNKDIVDTIKTLPAYNYSAKDKIWEIPVTCLAELIDKCCAIDSIDITLLKSKQQELVTYPLNNYKTKPFEYQKEGIQYGLNHQAWLLLDAPGLGKSLQILYIAQELKKRDKLEHCLIICGVNTLKTNWKNEIEKHTSLSATILGQRINTKGRLVIGSVKERYDQLQKKINEFFVITNIESLRDENIVKGILNGKNKFDMIVVDEIHTCKSPQSQQGKHLLKLNKSKYRIALTGTLLLNNPLDVYVPLKWIGMEKAPYSTFRYYYCSYGGPFHNELIGFKNMKVLKNQLEACSLRRTKDLLELPPKTIINEYVDMSSAQQNFYDNIKQGIIDQVDKVHMATASILGMVSRLRQATACPHILTTEDIDSAKVTRACDLAQQIIDSGYKVVIFSTFKETVYELNKYLAEYRPLICTGDQKDSVVTENVATFQSDASRKLFIGTWQKCGTGITLTAASYMIFLDTPWTAAVYQQAQDRIYRIGTKDKVMIYNLITKDTIDERVLEIVQDKEAIADYVIDDKISQSSIESLKKYIEEL